MAKLWNKFAGDEDTLTRGELTETEMAKLPNKSASMTAGDTGHEPILKSHVRTLISPKDCIFGE